MKEIRAGNFILAVDDDGEWRVYLVKAKPTTDYLVDVDLSYRGPGTTNARLHYGRTREPGQYVSPSRIHGIYDTAEEILDLIPTLESARDDLRDAKERFAVVLALLGNTRN